MNIPLHHIPQHYLDRLGDIPDNIRKAFAATPRELFVPKSLQHLANNDTALAIGWEQTISQPSLVARMTTLLQPQKTDTILELGTGSGFQAAILSHLIKHVYTIERIPELVESARKQLRTLKINNVTVIQGDGTKGLPDHAPYNGILVTARATTIPPALPNQLGNLGTLVIPVGESGQEKLLVGKKCEDQMLYTEDIAVRFVPLISD